jgi:hypothetical protein
MALMHTFPRGTRRRFLAFAAVAFWLGGFTFYAGVVIPVGIRVLGGHVRQGFITQQVTQWINVAALCAIPILFCCAFRPSKPINEDTASR